jgi:hypothetical protein
VQTLVGTYSVGKGAPSRGNVLAIPIGVEVSHDLNRGICWIISDKNSIS